MIPNYFPPIFIPLLCLLISFLLMSVFLIYIEKDKF